MAQLLTPEGWKVELAWLVDPQWTPYPRRGYTVDTLPTTTTCQPQINESPPAKDQRPPNH